MEGAVSFRDEFDLEVDSLAEAVQYEMPADARLLEQFGPELRRLPRRYSERLPPREHEELRI